MRAALRRIGAVAIAATTLAVFPAAPAGAASADRTVAQAVADASANAAANGVTQYLSVVDRSTGAVLAETGNAGTQVASESIMKLFLAAYYLVLNGGYKTTPADQLARLSYMLRVSDDATASALFSPNAVPTIAARYGMGSTTNATDRVGHWGAVRITAHDMTTFLWRASQDQAVGPWLMPVMAQTERYGSDGFDQGFGLNALGGDHGSKQGWGGDSFFTAQHNAVHSVGFTATYFVAVLQTAGSYPDPMRATATTAAQWIQSAGALTRPPDGAFVMNAADGSVYRMAGGAPVYLSNFNLLPGSTNYTVLSAATFAALPRFPADGTLLQAGQEVFVVAGGAPVYVSAYAAIGGYRSAIQVDPAAVARAGSASWWSHLAATPANGTLLQAGDEIYIATGGAPVYVSAYGPIGGYRPAVRIDPAAVSNAGLWAPWNHLRATPADGTVVQAGPGGSAVYVMAGGAPMYVSTWGAITKQRPDVQIDPAAVSNSSGGGRWSHLTRYPVDGTLVVTGPGSAEVYIMAGGAPVYVSDYAAIGGYRTPTRIDPKQVALAGTGGYYNHLRFRPADGTLLSGGGAVFVMAGGAPVYVSNWASIGGSRPQARVDRAAIDKAGGTARWSHLTATPVDGTLLQGGPTGAPVYVVAGGAPIYLASWLDIGGYRAPIRVDPAAVDRAASGGVWNHLLFVPRNGTLLTGSPGGRTYQVNAGIPQPTGTAGGVRVSQAAIDHAGQSGWWSHLKSPASPVAAAAIAETGPPSAAAGTTTAPVGSSSSATTPVQSTSPTSADSSTSTASPSTSPSAVTSPSSATTDGPSGAEATTAAAITTVGTTGSP